MEPLSSSSLTAVEDILLVSPSTLVPTTAGYYQVHLQHEFDESAEVQLVQFRMHSHSLGMVPFGGHAWLQQSHASDVIATAETYNGSDAVGLLYGRTLLINRGDTINMICKYKPSLIG